MGNVTPGHRTEFGPSVTESAARPALTLQPASSLLTRVPARSIGHAEVHVWAFDLDASAETLLTCTDLLSPEERTKGDRFVFQRDRGAYLVSHAVMRVMLGSYVRRPPEELQFVSGAQGKPQLFGDVAAGVSFNLTHSGGRALLAVSDGREIGIDLEQHRPIEAESIAANYFFGSERDAILQSADTQALFFRYWTAKEAVLKGCGLGLSLPLDHFAVQFDADLARATVQSSNQQVLHADWVVQAMVADEGWSAAVAARGGDWRVVSQGNEA